MWLKWFAKYDTNTTSYLFLHLTTRTDQLWVANIALYIQISNTESGTHSWLQFAVFNQRSASSTLSIEVNSYGDWPGISWQYSYIIYLFNKLNGLVNNLHFNKQIVILLDFLPISSLFLEKEMLFVLLHIKMVFRCCCILCVFYEHRC